MFIKYNKKMKKQINENKFIHVTPANEKIIIDVPEDTSYEDFAIAVANILKEGYGQHNFRPFVEVLIQELKS